MKKVGDLREPSPTQLPFPRQEGSRLTARVPWREGKTPRMVLGIGKFCVNVGVWMKCLEGPKIAAQAINRQGRKKARGASVSMVRI